MHRYKMFNLLSQEELEYLAPRALKAEFTDREIIIEKGQFPIDKMYMIISGQVHIEDYHEEGSKKCFTKILNQNEFFGLREMLYDKGNSCQSNFTYTSKNSKIMAIHVKDFLHIFPKAELEKIMEQLNVNS